MATKCPKCDFANTADSKFCKECGTQLIPLEGPQVSKTLTLEIKPEGLRRGIVFAGRYEILEELGGGGMGKVYRVHDRKLEEEVALKLIRPEIAADRKAIERFKNELKVARKITHKSVCKMYDLGESEGASYITMEYVAGEDLRSFIRRSKQLTVGTSVSITRQVAEGLAEAHGLGVVHRDLKPGNIMIDKEGNAKVMDFGIARSLLGKGLTGEGAIIGTPEYMSPEQVEGKEADVRADIYALGIILFEMVTSRPPFEGETSLAVAHKQRYEPAPDPRALNPQIPEDLVRLVLRCLEKEREKRYQTTDELLSDLAVVEAALPSADRAVAGRPPTKYKLAASRKVTLELTPRKLLIPALALLAIVAVVIGLMKFLPKKKVATPLVSERSVAVLPFRDMSTDGSSEHLADGISDALISALGRLRDLRVPGRNSAFSFKGQNVDYREIGQKLSVRTVLEGSVQVMGDKLRITARLIGAEDGFQLWSEKYDRKMEDVFDIQDEIASAIVEHLKVTLLSGEKAALLKRPTTDAEAYNLYLKGLYFHARPSPESLGKALDFFHEALDRDPNFSLAHAAIATVYLTMANMNLAPPAETYQKAKAALKNAFALDPNLPEALGPAATLEFYFEWNWTAAEKSFGRVLELSPGNALAHMAYAWLLMSRRRFEESLAEIKRALTLEPLMPLFYACSIGIHVGAGRYDEALGEFAKSLEIDPNFGLAYFHAGTAYYFKGLFDKAIETFQKARQLAIIPGWGECFLLLCHLKNGDRGKAERTLAEMLEDRKKLPVSPVCLAWGLAALGDFDGAFKWLETGIREHDGLMPFIHIYTEMVVPALTRDPRFGELLKNIGFK
jgi:TolB-like protein/Tfp pilus assembly protein PilF/predicted Ser/Thr protein kinase